MGSSEGMEGQLGVARIEAFSDGVIAIAITLLILEIHLPEVEAIHEQGLWRVLRAQWPSYVAFSLSFAVIGIMWANHHNIFRFIGSADHRFVMLNLALLFGISFLPFPTAVLAECLPLEHEGTPAAVFYGATLTVTAIVYNLLWRYASSGGRLLRPGTDPTVVAAISREYLLGPFMYAAATAAAFASVALSLAIHAFLAALYMFPNRTRVL